MASQQELNAEEQRYQAEVAEVKKWWSDSRWRYTKRPFTAEQIVGKRGNLKIEYASNHQSKKLWKILEGRWKVGHCLRPRGRQVNISETNCYRYRTRMLASRTDAWIQSWSLKWRSTWTPSTSPAGNVPRRPPAATSPAQILPTTPW
jgi:Isocitrate lyase family